MSVFQPFAFQQGAVGGGPVGFDPTFGGTLTPNYWWDCQDYSTMTLSGTSVVSMTSKGSETNGTLTSTGTAPVVGSDNFGTNDCITFNTNGRLGSSLTLIPHQQDITVFVAFNPITGGGGSQVVFGHEGYTYSGNFVSFVPTATQTKGTTNTQQYIFNDITEGYGVAGVISPASILVDTRPRPESITALWTRSGAEALNTADIYDLNNTMIATREYFNPGTPNEVRVKNAYNRSTLQNEGTTIFTPSTDPSDGTAIGQQGRTALNANAYKGRVYQVIVYFSVLTTQQISDLYDGWNNDFVT